MPEKEPLISKHGGYRRLKSFQVAQLVYDLTVRFCNHYVDRKSRTHDQMVQAARSGVQNIAEGSQASGTSKKMEMKLTGVARASLEELRLDYEDYLRHHSLSLWDRNDPRRAELIAERPATEADIAEWARTICRREALINESTLSTESTESTESTRTSAPGYPEILANAALALLAVSCTLLDRQLKAQAAAFETAGGFTERLYGRRKDRQKG